MPSTITPQIVTMNATVTTAPLPSTLQQSGVLISVDGGTTLTAGTYQYCGNLAAVTAILGSSGPGNYVELAHMAGTFFAQGGAVGVYVLELGTQANVAAQIGALAVWYAANPGIFSAYLVPVDWDTLQSTLVNSIAEAVGGPTGKTYLFVTTSTSTIGAYSSKAVVATVPSPTAASTEFQAAALFYQWLANNPSLAAPSGPMNFRFLYGVTPWVLTGNSETINTILTASGNVILTGAEGGISTALLRNGTTMDGNQMMFWYAIDWILINADVRLSAAVINGSNSNPPLLYNQFGINYLLGILQNLGTTGISIGLLLSATFTAVPFATYIAANPSNYAAGIYGGLACIATPQLGFQSIIFYLDATTFA